MSREIAAASVFFLAMLSACSEHVSVCGNGIIEAGEECDGEKLDWNDCEDLGFGVGTLSCSDQCMFDTRKCRTVSVLAEDANAYDIVVYDNLVLWTNNDAHLGANDTRVKWIWVSQKEVHNITRDLAEYSSPYGSNATLGALAADSFHAYFAVFAPPSAVYLLRAQWCLNCPMYDLEELLQTDRGVRQLALAGSYLYWTNSHTGEVLRMQASGGIPELLATDQKEPFDIITDSSRVYWTNKVNFQYDINTGPDDGGQVVSLPLDGGSVTVLAAGQKTPQFLAQDRDNIYWTTRLGGEEPFEHEDGQVVKVAKEGGEPIVLAYDQKWPTGIAVDSTHAYWINKDGGEIMRVGKGGGDEPEIFATEQNGATIIGVDSENVYWIKNDELRMIEK